MNPLQDVWLPEVEAEYAALLALSRDVGVDVGNQFRAWRSRRPSSEHCGYFRDER
jgi:hypothetical protein